MAPTLIRQAMHMIPMTGGRRRDPTGLMGLTTEMTEAGEEREAAREEISGTEVPLQQAAAREEIPETEPLPQRAAAPEGKLPIVPHRPAAAER